MSIPLNMKRDDLLAKLRALLPAAEKHDKQEMVKHRKEEQAYLRKFREACQDAIGWTYEVAAKRSFDVVVYRNKEVRGWQGRLDRPTCPVSKVARLTRAIETIEISTMTRFVMSSDGKYKNIYLLLTENIVTPKAEC